MSFSFLINIIHQFFDNKKTRLSKKKNIKKRKLTTTAICYVILNQNCKKIIEFLYYWNGRTRIG